MNKPKKKKNAKEKILDLLKDGRFHSYLEIINKCCNSTTRKAVLYVYIKDLRKELPPGQDIMSVNVGYVTGYQLVRKLHGPED